MWWRVGGEKGLMDGFVLEWGGCDTVGGFSNGRLDVGDVGM